MKTQPASRANGTRAVSRDPKVFPYVISRQTLRFDSQNRGSHKLILGPVEKFGSFKSLHFGKASVPVTIENGICVADVPRIHLPMPGVQTVAIKLTNGKSDKVLFDMIEQGSTRQVINGFVNRRNGRAGSVDVELAGAIDKGFTHVVVQGRTYKLNRNGSQTSFSHESPTSGRFEMLLFKPETKKSPAKYLSADLQLNVV